MRRGIICTVSLFAIWSALSGCGPDKTSTSRTAEEVEEVKEETAAAPVDPLREVFSEVRGLLGGGDTNGAIQVLERAFDDPQLAESRPKIYKAVGDIMLMQGRVDELKTRLARDFKEEPAVSAPSLGLVYGYYLRQDDRDGALEWVEHLLSLGLEDGMQAKLQGWQAMEYLQKEDDARVLEVVGAAVKELPGTNVVEAVSGVLGRAIGSGQSDLAEQILVLLGNVSDGGPQFVNVSTAYGIELKALRGDFAGATVDLVGFLESGSDMAVAYVFGAIAKRAREAENLEAVDNLCMAVLKSPHASDGVRRSAVARYCGVAAEPDRYAEFAERAGKLLDAGVRPSMLRRQFMRECPKIMQTAGDDVVRALIATAERLAELSEEDSVKDECLGLALDGYVTLQDYRKAVDMVDAGFREDKPEWRKVVAPKLRAHLALKEGNTEDAIRHFREFMSAAAASDTTPGNVNLAETLGMNAARIGDLWAGLGEEEKAKAAYTEARDHYTEALGATELLEDQKKEIEDQLARLAGLIGAE